MDTIHNCPLRMNIELTILQVGLYILQDPEVVIMKQEHATIGI